MPEPLVVSLATPEDTERAGRKLAAAIVAAGPDRLHVHLRGELGAGKTSLVRAVLSGLGHEGRVPSPTYTLVEPYDAAGFNVFHIDLYRIEAGAELDFLGLEELDAPGTLLLIEWPERGAGRLADADLDVEMELDGAGRAMALRAAGGPGRAVLDAFAAPRGR